MGDNSAIGWTEATWNPLVGCSRVSEGCRNCYAERVAHRLEHSLGMTKYFGTTRATLPERWTGDVYLIHQDLDIPLRWKRPRRIFVNSMSDLFHEKVRLEWIKEIFLTMARAPQHQFQILTKRPERMLNSLVGNEVSDYVVEHAQIQQWPLPNVWLGVSIEDQETADQRLPVLLKVPATIRWVSYEPALGKVVFNLGPTHLLHWIVVGGESGRGARPFYLEYARDTIQQARLGGWRVFVKQLGADPRDGAARLKLRHSKGADMTEWPDDLRVQDYPA